MVNRTAAHHDATGHPGRDLLEWLDAPNDQRGIRFAENGEGWRFVSYSELAHDAHAFAGWLREHGPGLGKPVPIVVPTGPRFVAAYYGVMLAGCIPSPLVPPAVFEDPDVYVQHTAALLRGRELVVTEGEFENLLCASASRVAPSPRVAVLAKDLPADDASPRPDPAPLALVQFSSGSSGTPRGVRVTWDNLRSMVDYIFTWVRWEADDAGAHWLPLHHDFGLIGGLIAPATRQRDLWVLRPEQFIMQPERWIDCFGRHGAAFAATPGFAFAYALRKIPVASLAGSDFGGWKAAILGAERLDPALLARFARWLGPYGFDVRTFMPAYGMAEATLGTTGVPREHVPTAVRPSWSSLRFGRAVEIEDSGTLADTSFETGVGWVIGCGVPHEGTEIEIRGDELEAVAEGCMGEIYVRGPTVADGYEGDAGTRTTEFADGWLRTGDAGFVLDGELYVIGRLGDALKIRGRSVFAEDLEDKLGGIAGLRRGRCVVLTGAGPHGAGMVAAIVERDDEEWVQEAYEVLAREVGDQAEIKVLRAPRGAIRRTSSGKPRRRMMFQDLAAGTLPVVLVRPPARVP